MRSADENPMSVGGSRRTRGFLIATLAVLSLAAYPGGVARGEADREKEGDPEGQAPANRSSERPDRLRERETARREMGSEQPDERQKFFLRKRSPDGVSPIPMEKYVRALKHMELMPQYSTVAGQNLPSRAETAKTSIGHLGALGTWSSLGPGNVGGRTRAFLIHPSTPAIMYAAGVSGGIWKSMDAGASWTPLADLMANINICTLAMDPHNPNVIYAGTGEMFNGAGVIAQIAGAGIFKTTDGGTTWTQLPATNTWDFNFVTKIAISPLASNRIYAGTSTGVWRSTDSGATWTKSLSPSEPITTDLVIRTDRTTDVVFAAVGMYAQATIYRNLDAGGAGSWTAVYTEPNMSRTSLAIAPSNQGTMYALSATHEVGNYQNGLLAVFQSTDGGGTWTARVRNTDPTLLNTCLLSSCSCTSLSYSQGNYDNVIAVDPLDPNRVWVGGINLFRSDDGAATWGLAKYIHVDHHAIVFHPQFNGTTIQTMYVGNDGGLFRTDNARGTTSTNACAWPWGTVNWTSLNNGYGVTQFYYGLPYPDGATYFGGTQDNGTIRGADGGGPNAWTSLWGGDGGYVAVDPCNTNILYAENIGLSIQKSTDGGTAWASATSGIEPGGPLNPFNWILPFVMDPSNASNLWTGGRKPWRTTNGATTWVQAGAGFPEPLPGYIDVITAVTVAPTDGNYVLLGLGSGAVARSQTALTDNSSSVWAEVRPVQLSSYTSSVTFDPTNKDIAYATYALFGVPHVWKSTDGGATFVNIDGAGVTGIPDIPVHSIVVDPTNTSRLYIGTDLGVFTSIDGGASWAVENTGFANVITESLAITGSELFAFTYGRGAYRVSLATGTTAQTLTVTKVGTGTGTLLSSPCGISCGATCSAGFKSGTVVTLTASADAGSSFTGWSGDCAGSGSCQVTMSQARSVTATFTLNLQTLTVSKAGTGTGTVSSSPPGISCGTTCLAGFNPGTVVTLTASADAGSSLTGWSGDCAGSGACQVTMSQPRNVTATFTSNPQTLTVVKAGTGTGTVSSSPSGISCGATCSTGFNFGTVVTLTASADAGSSFTGWGGDCTGSGVCQMTMSQARSVMATFSIPNPRVLTVTKAGPGTGTVTSSPAGISCGAACSTTFNSGTVVTLTAAADAGSTFTGWGGDCAGSGSCQVTMSQARSVTAAFGIASPVQFSQQGPKLLGTGGVGAAQQGFSVSLSADGSTGIVGGASDNGGAGAAWVWTRSRQVWTQQGIKLVGSGAVVLASQGWSVSLSADGNTAIVGGIGDSSYVGAAWVWTRSGGVWAQQGTKLVGSGAVGAGWQGVSVSLSADGNTAIVGGFQDNSGAGAAWVWTRSGGVWTQQGSKLVGSGAVGGASQGYSVSLSADGNTAIVGGVGDNGGAGAAWIWTRSGGIWTQQGSKLVGSGAVSANQGGSVSLSADGNTAIVGGPGDNSTAGAAWIWTKSGGIWTQQGSKLVGSGAVGNAQQGRVCVSADGNTAIVGGPLDNGTAGAAWVWARSGGVWTQQGTKLVGSGAVGGASQGYSVFLSADGNTAIVGGDGDSGNAGAAWVFTASSCTPAGNTLCLGAGRFQLSVAWKNYNDGTTGSGVAVKLTDDCGYFWFFNSANVELVLKVLDGRAVNGNYWVFYGALSDVEYTITVTDTQTGAVKAYHNPPHNLASVADTAAFTP